jgi:hypothetical protein
VNCGCQFNVPSTHGYCWSAYTGTVLEGYFNDTQLAGLDWACFYKWPGEIADGDGKRQIIIDERADAAQRNAMETIISGEAGVPFSNHFSIFGSLCTEFCDTLFLPIHIDADFKTRTAKVSIVGILEGSCKPIHNDFSGEPFHIALARPSGSFEFSYAEIGVGTTRVTAGIEMAYEDTYAHFCIHHHNQDGIIRPK